jgi:pentatricopeptide repeat protein
MLSKLKSVHVEAEEEGAESGAEPQEHQYATMLQAMCKWGKVQSILDLINEWLESALVTETDANKVGFDLSVYLFIFLCSAVGCLRYRICEGQVMGFIPNTNYKHYDL